MTKKIICLIITIAMVLTMMPAMAVAANTAGLENFKKVQTYKDGQFTDVKAKDWFAENVEASYELNLMVGKSDKFFDTESNLTVAEAMTIAARLREIYYTGKAEFKQGQPWYKVYTDYCKENKIADPADYDLNKAITRGQFAEIFSKAFPAEALKKINNVQDNMIPDVSKTDKFSAAIYLLYRAGILTGNDSKGTFASNTNIRRIEAAAITTRMAQPALRKSITLVKQSSGGNYTPRYTITFDVNGHGTAPAEQTIRYGNKITKPANPTEAGYTFNAWYKEKECINEWEFATDKVTKNTTLYAKWTAKDAAIEEAVVDGTAIKADGKTVPVTSGDENQDATLTEAQATALAGKINGLLENPSIADFTGDKLEESTNIDTTGLNAIITALKTETSDPTAKENLDGKTSADVDLQIKVVLSAVNIKSTEEMTVTSMEFDVTPIATTTVKDSSGKTVSVSADIKSCLNKEVTFRLPIDSSLNVTDNIIAVYHESEFIGNYKIQGVAPNTYIEIESKNFSKYGYQLVNINNAGAKIGETLYFKFADAVAAVENKKTITLLKPATGKAEIAKEISFTVDKKGKAFNATVSAGEGFVLSSTDATQATITYKCFPVNKQFTITYKDQGGTDFTGTHGANYPTSHTYGTATTLVSPTKTGYTFDGWYAESDCSGEKITTLGAEGYTTDITLYAKWTINSYNVNAQVQGSHGKASAKVDDDVVSKASYNATVAFEAKPDDGYEFDYWEVVSGVIDIGATKTTNPISLTMPASALTLKAHFKAVVPATYNIIVEDDGHGTAKAQVENVDATSAAPSTTVTLVPTANDGYAFKSWQIGRGLEAGAITDNTFTMPSNEVKVKAVFEKEYAVEAEAGGHGTVSADVAKGISGKEVNLTITPDEGYEVDQITVVRGGVTVTGNKFNIGTADVKIRVTFKAVVPSTYNIIVEDDGHGTASADPTSAAPGSTVTLTATPNDGYAFKEWEIARGLDSITGNSFTMPSNEVKVKAIFERVYNITIQTNEHGTASATVGGKTATTAAENAEVTLTATPDEGYQFKEWNVVSGGVTVTDNKFTMPVNNVTVQAVFEGIPASKTVADILPNDFPTSKGDAWKNDTNSCYISGNDLYLEAIVKATFNLPLITEVSGSGDGFTCSYNSVTFTFNMTEGELTSIGVVGTEYGFLDGIYAAPTFKAVYDTTDDANTLAFYYDSKDHSGENITVYDNLPTAANKDAAWGYHVVRKKIKKVVITESVKEYSSLTSTACMFHDMTIASSIEGAEYLDVSNVTDMAAMFWNFGSDESSTLELAPEVENWKTGQVTTMQNMFMNYGAGSDYFNAVPDVGKWNIASVTNMINMFTSYGAGSEGFNAVPDVGKWNTASVTNMNSMFESYGESSNNLNKVPDVSKWNTVSVTNMGDMFLKYGYTSTALNTVPDVSGWNTSSVTTMGNMFQNYGYSSTALSTVPNVSNWKTGKVTSMTNMFNGYGYTSKNISCVLDLSGWDLSKITSGGDVFNFKPSTFNVTIPATTGAKSNEGGKWYYGDGTNSIAPPTDKTFTPAAP